MTADSQARARLTVRKWKPFMNKEEYNRWKREGSPAVTTKLHKK